LVPLAPDSGCSGSKSLIDSASWSPQLSADAARWPA
jgi:hypothetical protein